MKTNDMTAPVSGDQTTQDELANAVPADLRWFARELREHSAVSASHLAEAFARSQQIGRLKDSLRDYTKTVMIIRDAIGANSNEDVLPIIERHRHEIQELERQFQERKKGQKK